MASLALLGVDLFNRPIDGPSGRGLSLDGPQRFRNNGPSFIEQVLTLLCFLMTSLLIHVLTVY